MFRHTAVVKQPHRIYGNTICEEEIQATCLKTVRSVSHWTGSSNQKNKLPLFMESQVNPHCNYFPFMLWISFLKYNLCKNLDTIQDTKIYTCHSSARNSQVCLYMAILCFSTFIDMWINVKGVISRIDAGVSVKLLTHRQRSVLSFSHLVCEVTYCQVLEIEVLEKKDLEGRVKLFFLVR